MAEDAMLRDAVQEVVDADLKIKSTLEISYPCGTPEADQKYIDRIAPASKIPLFQSYEVVDMEMKGDFSTINQLPARAKGLPGSISYRDRNGKTVTVPVSLTTRGHSKQRICSSFKPLQIQFDQDKATYKSTLFQHVGKNMKMATHCAGLGDHPVSDVNNQLVIREYANYRILEELGFKEFKARLVRMNYKDQKDKPIANGYAFFLEPSSKMAERWGYESGKKKAIDRHGEAFYMASYNLGRALVGLTDQWIGHNAFILAKDRKPAGAAFWDLDMTGLTNPWLASQRVAWGAKAAAFPPSGETDLASIKLFVSNYPEGKKAAEEFLDQMVARRDRVRAVINSLPIDKKDFFLQRLDTWFGAINHYRNGAPLPGQLQIPTDVPKGNY
jgi:hypothetical protein